MKFKKYASKKVVAIILSGLLISGGVFKQHLQIKQLQKDLYIQQNIIDNKYSYTQTTLLKDTIQEQLNEICKYEVINGTVNIKHSFIHERESILGLHSKTKLSGTADFYYSYAVDLSTVEIIKATDNKIIMRINKPYLDINACHRVKDSFYRIDDECSNNILSNKTDIEKTTRAWEDTFDTKGVQYITDYYNSYDLQKSLSDTTITQIKLLMKELGYSQTLIIKY